MTSSYSYAPPEPTRPASAAPTSSAGAGQRPRAGTGPGAIPISPQSRVDLSYPVMISPFTQVVVDTVRKLYVFCVLPEACSSSFGMNNYLESFSFPCPSVGSKSDLFWGASV